MYYGVKTLLSTIRIDNISWLQGLFLERKSQIAHLDFLIACLARQFLSNLSTLRSREEPGKERMALPLFSPALLMCTLALKLLKILHKPPNFPSPSGLCPGSKMASCFRPKRLIKHLNVGCIGDKFDKKWQLLLEFKALDPCTCK